MCPCPLPHTPPQRPERQDAATAKAAAQQRQDPSAAGSVPQPPAAPLALDGRLLATCQELGLLGQVCASRAVGSGCGRIMCLPPCGVAVLRLQVRAHADMGRAHVVRRPTLQGSDLQREGSASAALLLTA